MDDIGRWSNNTYQVPESDVLWAFSLPKPPYGLPSGLKFSIFDRDGRLKNTFLIHPRLGLMLAYLDLDYWSDRPRLGQYNQNRRVRYLGRLREDVVGEMLQCDRKKLLMPLSSAITALTPWAVRAYHGYGHSQMGRTRYRQSCDDAGRSPYSENPTNFGELSTVNPYTACIVLSNRSDWYHLTERHFKHGVQCPSSFCPTKVHSLSADIDMCAAQLFTPECIGKISALNSTAAVHLSREGVQNHPHTTICPPSQWPIKPSCCSWLFMIVDL
jgi:hypothetical protein